MSYYFPNSFQYAMALHITTHKLNKNHNLNSFWSCYLQSWDNTWNLIKQDIVLSSFCFLQKYTEQVERCQLVLEGLLIFDSSNCSLMHYIYGGCVLLLMDWVTIFSIISCLLMKISFDPPFWIVTYFFFLFLCGLSCPYTLRNTMDHQ